MVSLSNHEGVGTAAVRVASWFDRLTMKHLPRKALHLERALVLC